MSADMLEQWELDECSVVGAEWPSTVGKLLRAYESLTADLYAAKDTSADLLAAYNGRHASAVEAEAKVATLTADIETHRENYLTLEEQSMSERAARKQAEAQNASNAQQVAYANSRLAHWNERAHAAESALAAALTLLERLNTWNETEGSNDDIVSICRDVSTMLSSTPAPVAVPVYAAVTRIADAGKAKAFGAASPIAGWEKAAAPSHSLSWPNADTTFDELRTAYLELVAAPCACVGARHYYPCAKDNAEEAAPCAGCAELRKNQVSPAMVHEFESGKERREALERNVSALEIMLKDAGADRAYDAMNIGCLRVTVEEGNAARLALEQAIDAAVVELEPMAKDCFVHAALSALRAARSKS